MILWFSLAACILASIYLPLLGEHVLKRRVIFVDLALAQIAAVGYAIGIVTNSSGIFYASVITAAFVFIIAALPDKTVLPKEGVMGSIYAVATSLGMVILSSMPHAEGQMMSLLFGSMLGVNKDELMLLAASGLIAVLLMRYHNMQSYAGRVLFYSSLAIAIVPAIYAIGVILVFSLLVIPGLAVWQHHHKRKTLVAVTIACLGSTCGILLSNYYDYPPSSAVIICLSIIALCASFFWRKSNRGECN